MQGGIEVVKARSTGSLPKIIRPPEITEFPPISYPSGRGWYVVYTNPCREAHVEKALKALGFDTFLPIEERVRVRRGRRTKVSLPVFTRYVFVAFDPNCEEWYEPIRTTDGVECLLENNRVPVRVPTHIIDALRRAEANGAFSRDKLPKPGDEMKVMEGSFASFIGKVQSAKSSKRIKLLLNYMNREVVFEFPLEKLERTR